jgi:hypothetical protein
MKRVFLFLSITAMIFSFQEIHSQSLRTIVKRKILNDNLEAQAKRDSIKAVEEGRDPDPTPNTTMDRVYMDALGLTGNVAYEPSYDFDAYLQMEITNYKKNGKLDDQAVYDNYLNKQEADYAMVFSDKGSQSTFLFDAKNSAMLILTVSDGEKTGFATAIDPEAMAERVEAYVEEEDIDMDSRRPVKTGRTKNILGYSCDEYLYEDEDTKVFMWVSEKLGKEVRKEWMNNQQAFGSMFAHAYYLNGAVLEYDVLEESGERSVMLVTKIDMNHSHKVNTGDYAIMSLRQKSDEE